MPLVIEAPETIRLVEELARRRGEGAETVVEVALLEPLACLRTPEEEAERRAKVYGIVQDLQARFKASGQPILNPDELLYDENGLPK